MIKYGVWCHKTDTWCQGYSLGEAGYMYEIGKDSYFEDNINIAYTYQNILLNKNPGCTYSVKEKGND